MDGMLHAYLNRLSLAGYRPRTIHTRQVMLTAFGRALAPHQYAQATRFDVEAYLARPLSAQSRRAYRSHLRSFYGWMLEEGVITEDPTAKVPPIRVPRGTPRPLSEDDFDLALKTATPRMRAWLLLMALAGLRCMEVAGLSPADLLELNGDVLLFLRVCKGGGSSTVPAHPAILEALAALPQRDGRWWDVNERGVSRQVGEHLRGLGIDATAHQLRHRAATSWLRASEHDLLTTSRLMRHASVQTTQGYARLDDERPAAVVRAVKLRAVR